MGVCLLASTAISHAQVCVFVSGFRTVLAQVTCASNAHLLKWLKEVKGHEGSEVYIRLAEYSGGVGLCF